MRWRGVNLAKFWVEMVPQGYEPDKEDKYMTVACFLGVVASGDK